MNEVGDTRKHRMLVVDDEVGVISFLYDFFTNKNYEVFQASSGREALRLVKKEPLDLVLLDVKLGWRGDGIQVLGEIKKLVPDLKVIMMTVVADEDVVEKAFNLGADDYIVKPFSLSYLERIVMLKIMDLEITRFGKLGDRT